MDEEIRGFRSLLEYQRFLEHIDDRLAEGALVDTDVHENYPKSGIAGERWFTHVESGETWRLVPPDFPQRGGWERVLKADQVRGEYFALTRELLRDHPTELPVFEQLWAAGKLREAYLLVNDTMHDRGVVLSPDYRKVDAEFYWLFVQ